MFKWKGSSLETENKKLKRENETLRLEIAEIKETIDKLKQSQDEAVGISSRPRGERATNSQSQASSDTAVSELRMLIRDLQDRMTVAEQVTAATQRRELVQEGAYESLPTTDIYEALRFDPTQEHVYAKLQLAGCIIVFSGQEVGPIKKYKYMYKSSLWTCDIH